MEARMEAMRAFAMADPEDCDKEWAAYLALVRDKASASTATSSTPHVHNGVHGPAAVPASSTTHSTASLHATSSSTSTTTPTTASSASTSTRVSRPSTKDELSPGARHIYDLLVGSSVPPDSSTSMRASSSAVPADHEPAAATSTPASALDISRAHSASDSEMPLDSTPTIVPAVTATHETAALRPVTPSTCSMLGLDDSNGEFFMLSPTNCSSKCPSHDDAVSVSVLISTATQASSTTIGNVLSELAAPMTGDKALEVDSMSDTIPTAAICLPAGSDHSNCREDLVSMYLTLWSAPTSFNSLPRKPSSWAHARSDVLESCTWSPVTCSTIRSGSSIDTAPTLLAEAYSVFNEVSTEIVPWPPPSWTHARPSLIHGKSSFHHDQQKHGKEFSVQDTKGNWHAIWLDEELKPPWPSLGVCTNLPMGNLSNQFGSISVNDNSSPCASWCLDDVLWKFPKCWPDLPCAQPCWPDPPWPPPFLNMNTTCRILNLHGTLDNMQLSGDCQVLETWKLRLGAVLTVFILVPRVQKAQLKPTMFKWSYLPCSDIQFLSSSILDFLLARRPTYTLWTWGCLHNRHYSLGSNIFTISDWELLILSLKTWMLVNCDFASVKFQWSITVQQSPRSNGFLAILNGEAEVQWHCSCMWVLTDIVRKGWIHCLFLRVQEKNHWKNILVSLQFWFQYRNTPRESLHRCENFLWTIAWVLSYHFPMSTLQTLPHGAVLLVQLNYPAIYQGILVQVNYQPYSSNCSKWEIAWLLAWSSAVGLDCVCGLIATITFWLLFKLGVLPPLCCKDLSFRRYPSVDDIMPNSGCIIQCGFEHLQWKIAWSLNWECFEIAHSTSKELLPLHMGEIFQANALVSCYWLGDVAVGNMFCARFNHTRAYFLLVDVKPNNKDMNFWDYPIPSAGCVQLIFSCTFPTVFLLVGDPSISVGIRTLQLPWDPGDRISSVWHEGYPKGEDDTCFIPSIDTSQVPWDPGGLEKHRLGDKPKFKKGGLSVTFLSTSELGNVPAPLGFGLQEDTQDNHYIYLREGHGQGGLERNGWGLGLEGEDRHTL